MIGFMNLQLEEFLSKNKMQMAFSKNDKNNYNSKACASQFKKHKVQMAFYKSDKK